MSRATVTTQAELDAALVGGVVTDVGKSATWLNARSGSTVHAWSGSTVYAGSGSTVNARSGSTVTAGSGSTVDARSGSTVDARSGSTVTAWSGSTVHHAVVLLDNDGRGYRLETAGGRYLAGCRNFDAAEAVTHWSNPDHEAPESAARLLAAVQAHIAQDGAA